MSAAPDRAEASPVASPSSARVMVVTRPPRPRRMPSWRKAERQVGHAGAVPGAWLIPTGRTRRALQTHLPLGLAGLALLELVWMLWRAA